MISLVIPWRKFKQRRIDASYKRGYDYAAGAILLREASPLELQMRCCGDFNTNEIHNAFDRGVIDAVDKLCFFKVALDNRF